ncbi:MAG: DUF835 domain-containing protein [Thermoplasmata archaeon]
MFSNRREEEIGDTDPSRTSQGRNGSADDLGDGRRLSPTQGTEERAVPVLESSSEMGGDPSCPLPDVQKSCIYLVEEERPEKSYELFAKTLARGVTGLCATRVYPSILRQRYDFRDCVILWLSNTGKEDSVRPRDLERFSLLLEQFLSTSKGVVLIDGIEYLITNNDFVTVLRLVQSLRDQVAMNLAMMIISLNPSTLGFQELNLLEREMDTVLRLSSASAQHQ